MQSSLIFVFLHGKKLHYLIFLQICEIGYLFTHVNNLRSK